MGNRELQPLVVALAFLWPLMSLGASSLAESETVADANAQQERNEIANRAARKIELKEAWLAHRHFEYVYTFARRSLGMTEAQAKAFAAQAISECPTHEMLYRYLEAYQFATQPVSKGGLGFSGDAADRFSQEQEFLSSEDLYLYKVVYHEALADSLKDSLGKTHHLDSFQARAVAENMVHNPGTDYSRYHYVFNTLPVAKAQDFDTAMTVGYSLSQASREQFEKFQGAVDRDSHKMAISQAFTNAQVVVPIAVHSNYYTSDHQLSSTLPASMVVSPADQQSADSGNLASPPPPQGCPAPSQNYGSSATAGFNATLSASSFDALDPNLPYAVREDIYNAAKAFQLPEQFLACTMKIESHGNPTACSYKNNGQMIAAGIVQITKPTYQTISKLSHTTSGTNGYLGQGWSAYKDFQNDPNNPVREPSQNWPQSCFDPSWSVGAGALLFRDYAAQLFGPGTDPRTLNVDQLSMLAASYDAGPAGLKSYCHDMNDVQGCLRSLKYSRNRNMETHNYIIKMSSCLQNPGPEVVGGGHP